jgi:hypothetical protein
MMARFYVRPVAWVSVCVAALLAAPVSFGTAADRKQAQAQLLDHAEFLCANCFFGPSDYYFCFVADDKILIGYQQTPVLNWRNTSKNYLTKAHRGWAVWTAPGETVPISYDDKHIWVNRADGKQVRLTQDYSKRDAFINNDRCRAVNGAVAH